MSDGPCATGITGKSRTVSYTNDVLPLLRAGHCLNGACHGGGFNPTTDYDLRTYEGMTVLRGIEVRVTAYAPNSAAIPFPN
ncbi:MAG: hypothetical protein HY717_10875 [Planctomycetes bacterium]|nr:hypothetical protein [Planctomycetota bacterium]